MNSSKQPPKQTTKKHATLTQETQKLFNNPTSDMLWSRKVDMGWSTIPRTLPLIMEIIDLLSVGKPASKVYLALWARTESDSRAKENAMVVRIAGISDQIAIESGLSHSRKVSVLENRIQTLEKYGFIRAATSNIKHFGKYEYILILHPKLVIDKLSNLPEVKENPDFQALYKMFKERMIQIGAIKKSTRSKKAANPTPESSNSDQTSES